MGFVDLHNHLLWGLDDGAESAEESLAIAQVLAAHGWTEVATTPHARPEYPGVDVVQSRRDEVSARLADAGVALSLHPGAENVLDPSYLEKMERGDARGLGAAGIWVLLEAPFRQPAPFALDVLFRVRVKGKRALIAHPERCMEFVEKPERCKQAVEIGAELQLELGSFANVYGKPARELALRLVGEGLAAVVATDVHHLFGAAQMFETAIPALRKAAGEAYAERLLSTNPAAILRGEELLAR